MASEYQTKYPPGMTLRPIDQWPGPFTTTRRDAPFRSTLPNTLALLDREMRSIDPKDTKYPPSVLQIAVDERNFRVDGMPRADARPAHPGVILTVEPRNRPPVSFPCDTFYHWHDNLRAIALTLEALRKMDRYGVTQNGQQYRGWQAIEAKPAAPAMTAKSAIERLAAIAEMPPPSSAEGIALAARKARGKSHPDRNAGDRAQWDEVERLVSFLEADDWL